MTRFAFKQPTRSRLDRPYRRRGFGPWYPARCAMGLNGRLRRWLCDTGSLTAKLRRASEGQLQVEVLRQQWGRPRLSEARTLGIAPHSFCLIREVILRGRDNRPWVFARSLFPAASLKGRLRHLHFLDNRPLGGYLFSHPQLGRSMLQIASLPPGSALPAHLQGQQSLWGRRSVFTLYGKSLLVSEIFLPALQHDQIQQG